MKEHKFYPELCTCNFYSVKQTDRILRFHSEEEGKSLIEILEDTEKIGEEEI